MADVRHDEKDQRILSVWMVIVANDDIEAVICHEKSFI